MFRDSCPALHFIYSHASVGGGPNGSSSALWSRLTCSHSSTWWIVCVIAHRGKQMQNGMICRLLSKFYQRRKSESCCCFWLHRITGVALHISFSHICFFLFPSRVIMRKAFAQMQTQQSVCKGSGAAGSPVCYCKIWQPCQINKIKIDKTVLPLAEFVPPFLKCKGSLRFAVHHQQKRQVWNMEQLLRRALA